MNHFQLAVGRVMNNFQFAVGRVMNHFQLAQRRVGSTKSNSPFGELDVPSPTRPKTSWISFVQICLCRVGPFQNHAFSSWELPPSSVGQTVSCFVPIGVTVETLRKKRQRLIFSYKVQIDRVKTIA